jgi:hypothetical protein
MQIDYRQLKTIKFPIYPLPSDNIEEMDGLIFEGGFVVDDKNQEGETLGIRRLQSPHKLLPLRRCYYEVAGLMRSKNKIFIDSAGKVFIYQKTKMVSVKPHKILRVIPKDTYSVVKLSNIHNGFIVARPPSPGLEWASVLYLNRFPWLIYEFTEEREKTKKRKI